MANFETPYSSAQANQPILSSAWNQNIDATKERFRKHDHTGKDETDENGPRITRDGLAPDIFKELASIKHKHSGDDEEKIGKEGLDETVNTLLDKIAALETTVTNLQNRIGGLLVQPTITEITDTSDKQILRASVGDQIKIHGSNFYEPLTVRFKSIVVPVDKVKVAPDHNSINVTIPGNVEKIDQYITVSVGASAISETIVIKPPSKGK
jgi:hypothetical protein